MKDAMEKPEECLDALARLTEKRVKEKRTEATNDQQRRAEAEGDQYKPLC